MTLEGTNFFTFYSTAKVQINQLTNASIIGFKNTQPLAIYFCKMHGAWKISVSMFELKTQFRLTILIIQ